jgi:hypothetical protein
MDAAVLTYTEELQRRLQPPLAGPAHGGQPWLDAPPAAAAEGAPLGGGAARMGHVRSRSETDLGSLFSGESGGVRDNNERGQPFEFRALEMALEMACSQLHHQVRPAPPPSRRTVSGDFTLMLCRLYADRGYGPYPPRRTSSLLGRGTAALESTLVAGCLQV